MKEKADIVIADLPCSGLGVINKKPDILLRLTKEDLKELAYLQKKILSVVQSYVKPGGILLYSTCTINRDENENNAKWFIDHYAFKEEVTKQFLPGRDPYDGFFIARFKKY